MINRLVVPSPSRYEISQFEVVFLEEANAVTQRYLGAFVSRRAPPPNVQMFYPRTLILQNKVIKLQKYRRLHLPENALAQNMFSRDVKRLRFGCQTFKFSRPTVKFYFSTLLKGKMILINKEGRNYQKSVPL